MSLLDYVYESLTSGIMEYGPDGVIEIEDQDEEEEEEEEEDEDEDEEEEEASDDDGDSEVEELIPSVEASSRASNVGSRSGNSQEAAVLHDDTVNESNGKKLCKGNSETQENATDDGDGIHAEKFNRGEIDGLFCPICIEAWTSGGKHQICCLPCGHVYGLSCIKKWLKQRQSSGKCPSCNRGCTLKDIRVLYAARLCVVDDVLQKQLHSLEAECTSLKKQKTDYCKKEVEAKQREAALHHKVKQLTEKEKYLEKLLEDKQKETLASSASQQGYQRQAVYGHSVANGFGSQSSPVLFRPEQEFLVEGGRYFDMDVTGDIMIVARRLLGMGGKSVLTKISLGAPSEREDIELPLDTKAVRALCVKPCSRLVVFASLAKKLSVVSTESNNTVLTYDLPSSAWSCCWDISSPHHVYTGLTNGMVLAFDMRQTRTPLESRAGLSSNPVHTIISLEPDSSNTKTLLTASHFGMCEWNIGTNEDSPYLIPESANQGICVSLAHSNRDNIVASFRPKVEGNADVAVSQSSVTCTDPSGFVGSHIFYQKSGNRHYKRRGSMPAQMGSLGFPKSGIVDKQNYGPVFVSANKAPSELVLCDMSTLAVVQRITIPNHPVTDVRCTDMWGKSVLSCCCGDVVQLFT